MVITSQEPKRDKIKKSRLADKYLDTNSNFLTYQSVSTLSDSTGTQ